LPDPPFSVEHAHPHGEAIGRHMPPASEGYFSRGTTNNADPPGDDGYRPRASIMACRRAPRLASVP
jgi:hypothetical protein